MAVPCARAATLFVGPTRELTLPSQAAAAHDGDTVEIDPGDYRGDAPTWTQNDLTIRSSGGAKPRIVGDGHTAADRGLWAVDGRDVRIEDIEFMFAHVPAGNGAGLLLRGRNITIVNCYFHDNEDGILATLATGSPTVERSEFARNGMTNGQTHAMYVGRVDDLTVIGSYFHETRTGHHIKSRGLTNYILYNLLIDGEQGTASYAIEFPNGGRSVVVGNVIEKGPHAQNLAVIANGLEGDMNGGINPRQNLYVAFNTLVSDNFATIFLDTRIALPLYAIDNIFAGTGQVLKGAGTLINNLFAPPNGRAPAEFDLPGNTGNVVVPDAGFVDRKLRDYHLRAGSAAIGKAIDPANLPGTAIKPEYQHTGAAGMVHRGGAVDLGAYQFDRTR